VREAVRLALPVCMLLMVSPIAYAEEGLLERSRLTGDWGGLRPRLSEAGYDFSARYLTGGWANTLGGRQTGVRHDGFGDLGIDADLERIAGWRGGAFRVRWISYHGGKPSEDLVGQFAAQNLSGTETEASSFRFYTIFFEQSLFDDKLTVKVGQLAADDDFMLSRVGGELMNATFGDVSSLPDGISAPVYPIAAPGLYLELRPTEELFARIGAYTGDIGDDESSNWGFDWSFDHKDGAVFAGEVGWRAPVAGRDTSVLAGAIGSTGRRDEEDSDRGLYGLYLIADHDLLTDARDSPVLAAFVRLGYGPQKNSSLQRWIMDAGLVKYGMFGRRQDRAGLGFSYSRFTPDHVRDQRRAGANVTREQALIELSYQLRWTPWLTLRPSVQYIIDPHFSRDDALAVGLQMVIDF
jgi:porin